ncbi:MAG: hypothetical protein OXE99_03335 [Cellvibrionales bacterium]|nr:hypothetical protein [Cellvibrionales bacterium]
MEDLFAKALGLTSPWFIESINFDTKISRLDITINFKKGSTFFDSDDEGKGYKAYDTANKTWRHMNFFQHECYGHLE